MILVPVAIAAVSAWHASRTEEDEAGQLVCNVSTRMRDVTLLRQALTDTSATVTQDGTSLLANWVGVEARFTRDENDIWSAHLTGDVDEPRAVSIVTAIDQAYGLRVQTEVLSRLRNQASSAGMTIKTEKKNDDQSVTMVLAVQEVTS